MKKIRNVFKLMLLVSAIGMLAYLSYHLTLYTLFTGKSCGLTITGLFMFCLSCGLIEVITDDFRDQIKSIPSYQPKHAKGYTINNFRKLFMD